MENQLNHERKLKIFNEFLKYFTEMEKNSNPIYINDGRITWYRTRVQSIYNNEKIFLCLDSNGTLFFNSPCGAIPYQQHYENNHSNNGLLPLSDNDLEDEIFYSSLENEDLSQKQETKDELLLDIPSYLDLSFLNDFLPYQPPEDIKMISPIPKPTTWENTNTDSIHSELNYLSAILNSPSNDNEYDFDEPFTYTNLDNVSMIQPDEEFKTNYEFLDLIIRKGLDYDGIVDYLVDKMLALEIHPFTLSNYLQRIQTRQKNHYSEALEKLHQNLLLR